MTANFTIPDKLDTIARIIDQLRWGATPRHHDLAILKAIHADLRARLAGAPHVAEIELGRRINAAKHNPTLVPVGPMQALAQETIVRWPAIKQGLELLGATVEAEQ